MPVFDESKSTPWSEKLYPTPFPTPASPSTLPACETAPSRKRPSVGRSAVVNRRTPWVSSLLLGSPFSSRRTGDLKLGGFEFKLTSSSPRP